VWNQSLRPFHHLLLSRRNEIIEEKKGVWTEPRVLEAAGNQRENMSWKKVQLVSVFSFSAQLIESNAN